jgi:tetratricopeptide (TPR) repeat protein
VILELLAVAIVSSNANERLVTEDRRLLAALTRRCPDRSAAIATFPTLQAEPRAALFETLWGCARGEVQYLVRYGGLLNQLKRYREAEQVFLAALELENTQANQLGLLIALARQNERTPAQEALIDRRLAGFRRQPCTRDDLCAALCDVAWNLGDRELVLSSASQATALGFPGWQPHFLAGTVLATGLAEERQRAIDFLTEARRRGGPAETIDGFLAKLRARPPRQSPAGPR